MKLMNAIKTFLLVAVIFGSGVLEVRGLMVLPRGVNLYIDSDGILKTSVESAANLFFEQGSWTFTKCDFLDLCGMTVTFHPSTNATRNAYMLKFATDYTVISNGTIVLEADSLSPRCRVIENTGTLVMKDITIIDASKGTGMGESDDTLCMIHNSGILTNINVKFVRQQAPTNANYRVIANEGTMVFQSGTISMNGGGSCQSYLFDTASSASADVQDGTFVITSATETVACNFAKPGAGKPVLSGGTYNFDPSLAAQNATIGVGYAVYDNMNGTWAVDKAPPSATITSAAQRYPWANKIDVSYVGANLTSASYALRFKLTHGSTEKLIDTGTAVTPVNGAVSGTYTIDLETQATEFLNLPKTTFGLVVDLLPNE